ncbi:MAG: 30S ribosomal protein S20 [Candidatus Eisenbacteria bacterium]
MPHHKSAKKRLRTNEKKNTVNRASRSTIRTLTRKVDEAKTPEEGREALGRLLPRLDKAVKTNLMHKNTVARKKSRVQKLVNKLGATE